MQPARTAVLTSPRNPLLRDIGRAVARGTLTGEGFAVAESFHLLEEAPRSDREVQCVLAASEERIGVRARDEAGAKLDGFADE